MRAQKNWDDYIEHYIILEDTQVNMALKYYMITIEEQPQNIYKLISFTEVLMRGDKATTDADIPLYWDSWDHRQHLKNNLSPRVLRSRISRASVPSEDCLPYSNINNSHLPGGSVSTLVPSCSVSSINSLVLLSQNIHTTTPPLTPPVLSKTKWGKSLFISFLHL